jgi:hypothetical protein
MQKVVILTVIYTTFSAETLLLNGSGDHIIYLKISRYVKIK